MTKITLGRVQNPDDLDLEPVEIELVGYKLDRTEVAGTFLARPMIPAGAQLEIIRHTDVSGNVPLKHVVEFLEECLLESDLEPFRAFIHDRDVQIEQETISGLYRELTEYYAARPTRPPSASASTGSQQKRTSRAVARSAASASTKRRSS